MQTEKITIDDLDLEIAPTPIVHMAEIERHLADKTVRTKDGREALITAAFHGIRRARKQCPASGGITLEWLQENVDVHSVAGLLTAFLAVNFPAPPAGAPATGEGSAGSLN